MSTRRLKALQYAQWDKFNIKDTKGVRTLVVWLEETKIRHLPVEQRKGLRDVAGDAWQSHFKAYLVDIGCPLPATFGSDDADEARAATAEVLEWLLARAIKDEYNDRAAEFNAVPVPEPAASSSSAPSTAEYVDYTSPQFVESLETLAGMLGLPKEQNVPVETLLKCVRQRVNFLFLKRDEQANPAARKGVAPEEGKFALGFATNDKAVDEAALVTRLLYISELRDLQTQINEIIVLVQNFTANPRTDSRLGKVGR